MGNIGVCLVNAAYMSYITVIISIPQGGVRGGTYVKLRVIAGHKGLLVHEV